MFVSAIGTSWLMITCSKKFACRKTRSSRRKKRRLTALPRRALPLRRRVSRACRRFLVRRLAPPSSFHNLHLAAALPALLRAVELMADS